MISYTVTTSAGDVNNVKKIDLPVVTDGWKPSKKYLYTFEIELQNVTVGVESQNGVMVKSSNILSLFS